MPGSRKQIHAGDPFHNIPACKEYFQISGQAGGFAGNIEDSVHSVGDDFFQGFGMDTVSWGIEYDEIRFLFYRVQNFQHVSGQEGAVFQTV